MAQIHRAILLANVIATSIFGLRASIRPSQLSAEIHIRVALMNRFNALGTAEIVRVG